MYRLPNSHRHENWQRNCWHLAGLRWLRQYLLIKTCPDERVSAQCTKSYCIVLYTPSSVWSHPCCEVEPMRWEAVRELLCYFLFLFYLEMWERTVAEYHWHKKCVDLYKQGTNRLIKKFKETVSHHTTTQSSTLGMSIYPDRIAGTSNHGKSISAKLVQIKVTTGVADGGHRPFPSAVRSYSGAVGPGFLLL